MTNQPEAAWVEAAKNAADNLYNAIGSMEDVDLDLKLGTLTDVKGTNSNDSSFLDYLQRGEHLTGSFLASVE